MSQQIYKYQGEEFVITKPEACSMKVTKGRYTAVITIHAATNRFRESLDGWGTDQDSLERALNRACQRILDKETRPPKEELCSEMERFYKSLQ